MESSIKFTGSLKNMSSMKNLEYSYKTSGRGGGTREFDEPNFVQITSKRTRNFRINFDVAKKDGSSKYPSFAVFFSTDDFFSVKFTADLQTKVLLEILDRRGSSLSHKF